MVSALYAAAKTVVLWDTEDCKIPDGLSAAEVSQNIRTSLENKGYHGTVEIWAYGENSNDDLLSSAEMNLIYFPTENKDDRDKQILVDLSFCAVDNPAPANVMLIMGDISQENSPITILQLMKSHKYNVLLAQHQNASAVVLDIVSSVWLWSSLSSAAGGGMPIDNGTKTGVFWDIEDCKIPDGLSPADVSKNIKTALVEMGHRRTVSIKAYANETNQIHDDVFLSAGIELMRIPEGPRGNDRSRDIAILTAMLSWGFENREEESSTILVISDNIYTPTAEELTAKNHYVLWQSLSAEGKLIAQTRSPSNR